MNEPNPKRRTPRGGAKPQGEPKHALSNFRGALVTLLALALVAFSPARAEMNADDATLAFVGATIVDGTGRAPFVGTVTVRDGRIVAVGETLAVPQGARVIRAGGRTLMPGLFDLHTHLSYATAPRINADWPKNLKAYLYSGVTSVVDFGTYPETFAPMRRLIATGAVASPRIHFAARMTTPGGHGAEGGRGDFFTLEVQTPREARAAVRRLLSYEPDVIKVFTDGWRYNTAPDMTSMNLETLTALVEEAHDNGIEVLTHTVTLDGAKTAARAGVDVIAHGIGDRAADEELVRLMRERKTTYVSTLAVYEPRGRAILTPLLKATLEPAVLARIDPPLSAAPPEGERVGELPPVEASTIAPARERAIIEARSARWINLMRNISILKKGGVRFGAGTDAGVTGTHHGWATLRELRLLVAGGLTPVEAIKAATLDSARALRVEGERGSIEAGKLADLVLVDGAPHRDIADVERVARVFLGGREIDREQLAREMASEALTPVEAARAVERIDDFEPAPRAGANGGATKEGRGDMLRSLLGTLWVNSTDGGHDHSQVIFGRTLRKEGDRALSILARMSGAERPFVRLSVPLTRGAIVPSDASAWRGVRFDARGDGGEYRLIVPTRGVRDSAYFQTRFRAGAKWRTVKIDFSSLAQDETKTPVEWTGRDLLMLSFEVSRAPGAVGWIELDNLRFYK